MPSTVFRSLAPSAKTYVSLTVAAGAVTVAYATVTLIREPASWHWVILALLTLVSGSATVRLAALPATFSISETFVFTSVLLFGSAAGTITVALDALVISFWSYRKGDPLFKIIFNLCAASIAIWLSSQVFFFLADIGPLFRNPAQVGIPQLLGPLLAFTLLYWALNSWLIAFAISLERRISAFAIWRNNFVWLSLNYFGGASVAVLLVSYTKELNFTYLAVIIPLLVVLYLTFSTSMGRVEDANRHLSQLNALYMSTIETLAMAIDAKDQITHGHIRRVQTYAVGLARHMGVTDERLIKAVEAAALLHDMGKLAVPEYILNKPGPLTPAEFEKMKLHASVGADILSSIDFPYPVVPIVRHHHESWNGTGYPDGLAGADIPIGARILSVVDCFDALTSDRPYRPRLSDKDAIKILLDRRGTMYDPLVVDTFIRIHADIAPESSPRIENVPLQAITEASLAPSTPAPTRRRLDEIASSTEEMLTLFDLARGLTAQMSLQDVGDMVSKHLRRLIPSSLAVFFSYEVESDELVAVYCAGESCSLVAGMRIGVGQRLSGWVAAHRQTIRNADPVLDFGESARAMTPRPRSCLSTPLLVGQQLIGVLSLYSTNRDAFTEEHQRVAEVISGQVAGIVHRAIEFERDRTAILRDPLTGLPNVERLREIAESQLVTQQFRQPTSLLLIDIDDFGKLNAEHGRGVGDEILAEVVRATRGCLRAADFLFRLGSDEFVALLLQTDKPTASSIALRINESIRQEQSDLALPRFEVSVAIVTAPDDGASVGDLLNLATIKLSGARRRPAGNGRSDSVH